MKNYNKGFSTGTYPLLLGMSARWQTNHSLLTPGSIFKHMLFRPANFIDIYSIFQPCF